MKKIIVLILLLSLMGCQENIPKQDKANEQKETVQETVQENIKFESKTIESFYDELFIEIMSTNPQWIDDLGDLSEYGVEFKKDQLTIIDDAYYENLMVLYDEALLHLESFDVDDSNYKYVKWFLEMAKEGVALRDYEMFLSHIIGEHRWLYNLLLDVHVIETEEDANDWIARVLLSGESINVWIDRFEEQNSNGYPMDSHSLDATISQVKSYFSSKAKYTKLYKTYSTEVDNLELGSDKKEELKTKALDALNKVYIPHMEKLLESLNDARKVAGEPKGLWALPGGDVYYDYILKKHTTTNMTPDEIHALGLSEVQRIQEEMTEAFSEIGYEGDLSSSLNSLFSAAKVYRGQDAMDRYVEVAATIEMDLGDFFYEKNIPASSPTIKTSPGGNFYITPSIDGKRPGVYYLDLGSGHADFTINTLAYHETVPGHHLEREHELLLTNIPMVRKLAFNTAYIEGWALYAEMLADEYGYNETPAHHIGYLKSELHRAARLVVDTGIHHKKWTRQEAIDYLVEEGLLHPGYASAEVTRYTSWPGQACSYKIGQLKLLELRDKMETALGDAYDIRDFHHLVLGEGSMPLALIEEKILSYIEDNK